MAGGTFPTSLPSYPAISASETLGTMGGSVGHKATHDHEETDITALTSKVGIGSNTPAVGQVLACPGTDGTTVWTGGMVRLAKTVLGSATPTVDFTSISNGYSALLIQITARGSLAAASDGILMRVGSSGTLDSGANYDWNGLFGSGAATSYGTEGAVAASSATIGYMAGNTGPASEANMIELVIPNYAAVVFNKRWRSTNSNRTGTTTATEFAELFSGGWRSTAAINVIRFFCGANFATGSTFTLWGLG